MVPAIREARARVSLVGITAPGTEFFRPETKPKFRPVSPARDRISKTVRQTGRANAACSHKVSVTRNSGDCLVGPGDVPTLCNFNDFVCPTGLKALSARKGQFPELSNPHGPGGAAALSEKPNPVPADYRKFGLKRPPTISRPACQAKPALIAAARAAAHDSAS